MIYYILGYRCYSPNDPGGENRRARRSAGRVARHREDRHSDGIGQSPRGGDPSSHDIRLRNIFARNVKDRGPKPGNFQPRI